MATESTLGLSSNDEEALAGLEPARTALVGLHWQQGVVRAGGFFGNRFAEPLARSGALDRAVEVTRRARSAGALDVQVKICNPPDTITNNPLFRHAHESGSLPCGAPETDLIQELAEPDLAITHHRASAFVGTPLAQHLNHRGIRTIALTGVSTHVAVEGTAREAIDQGLDVLLLADCCAAPSEAVHEDAVERLSLLVTAVTSGDRLVSALEQAS